MYELQLDGELFDTYPELRDEFFFDSSDLEI